MTEIKKNCKSNKHNSSSNLHQNDSKFQVNLNSIAKEINSYNNNRSSNKILREKYKNLKNSKSSDKKAILNKKYMKLFEKDLENVHFYTALNSIEEEEDEEEFITIDLQKKTLKKLLRNYNEEKETNLLSEVNVDGIECDKKLDLKTKMNGNNEENLFLCAIIDLIEGKNNTNNNKKSKSPLFDNENELNTNNKKNNSSKNVNNNDNMDNFKFYNMLKNYKNCSAKSTKSTSVNIECTKTSTKHNTVNTNKSVNISIPTNNLVDDDENLDDDSFETLELSDLKKNSLNSNEFDFTNDQLVRIFKRFKSDFGGKNESLKFEIEQILTELNTIYTSNDVIYKRYNKYVSLFSLLLFIFYLDSFNSK